MTLEIKDFPITWLSGNPVITADAINKAIKWYGLKTQEDEQQLLAILNQYALPLEGSQANFAKLMEGAGMSVEKAFRQLCNNDM